MAFAFPPPEQVYLDINGTDARFAVRRIYCVGKNYTAHVIEMGGDVDRDPPVIFQKPADAVVRNGGEIGYPVFTKLYHYEGEMVVALKSGGHHIKVEDAASHIFGYAVGLDMTRRDHQAHALTHGLPWEVTKSFDQSAPMGPITKIEDCGELTEGRIKLSVNGELRQDADMSWMIWKTAEIISKLSEQYRLMPGDLIMTGTPAGVGEVRSGDQILVEVEGLTALQVTIGAPVA